MNKYSDNPNVNMFLNWDHEIIPTTVQDVLEMAALVAGRRLGGQLRYRFEDGKIEFQRVVTAVFDKGSSFGREVPPYWSTVILHDFTTVRDIVGRLGWVYSFEERLQLEAALKGATQLTTAP